MKINVIVVTASLFVALSSSAATNSIDALVVKLGKKLEGISSYELNLLHTGRENSTGYLISRRTAHLTYENPGLFLYESVREGLLVNYSNEMDHLADKRHHYFDGSNRFSRVFADRDSDKVVVTFHSTKTSAVLPSIGFATDAFAPDSDYIGTIDRLLHSYKWKEIKRDDKTITLSGLRPPLDEFVDVPEARRWTPSSKVDIQVDTGNMLVTQYSYVTRQSHKDRFVRRTYVTTFSNIKVNPELPSSQFVFKPLPGEKIRYDNKDVEKHNK